MIAVLAVEDDALHLQNFREAVQAAPDLHWCAGVGNVRDGIAALEQYQPDVVLVDLGLPDASGLEVVHAARRLCPRAEVMVVSVFGDESTLLEALRAGATGYLLKDAMGSDFLTAIRDIHAGRSPISPSLARHLLRAYRPGSPMPAAAPGENGLSERETEILQAVSRGHPYAEIAQRHFISPHTVATHVKNIYRKLEAHSKVQALSIARERGLLK
jgi:DNA-binding NarL/FixJ family response regulator